MLCHHLFSVPWREVRHTEQRISKTRSRSRKRMKWGAVEWWDGKKVKRRKCIRTRCEMSPLSEDVSSSYRLQADHVFVIWQTRQRQRANMERWECRSFCEYSRTHSDENLFLAFQTRCNEWRTQHSQFAEYANICRDVVLDMTSCCSKTMALCCSIVTMATCVPTRDSVETAYHTFVPVQWTG